MAEYQNVRDSVICPACFDTKDVNTLVCWDCYKYYGMRYQTPDLIQRRIEQFDNGQFAGRLIRHPNNRKGN